MFVILPNDGHTSGIGRHYDGLDLFRRGLNLIGGVALPRGDGFPDFPGEGLDEVHAEVALHGAFEIGLGGAPALGAIFTGDDAGKMRSGSGDETGPLLHGTQGGPARAVLIEMPLHGHRPAVALVGLRGFPFAGKGLALVLEGFPVSVIAGKHFAHDADCGVVEEALQLAFGLKEIPGPAGFIELDFEGHSDLAVAADDGALGQIHEKS